MLLGQQEVNWLVHKLRATFPASEGIHRTNRPEKRAEVDVFSSSDGEDDEQSTVASPLTDEEETTPTVNLEELVQ